MATAKKTSTSTKKASEKTKKVSDTKQKGLPATFWKKEARKRLLKNLEYEGKFKEIEDQVHLVSQTNFELEGQIDELKKLKENADRGNKEMLVRIEEREKKIKELFDENEKLQVEVSDLKANSEKFKEFYEMDLDRLKRENTNYRRRLSNLTALQITTLVLIILYFLSKLIV